MNWICLSRKIPSCNFNRLNFMVLVLYLNINTSPIWYLTQFNVKAPDVDLQTKPEVLFFFNVL